MIQEFLSRKQTLTQEQMKFLRENGIDTSNASAFEWYSEGNTYLYWGKCSNENGVPVFTEGDMLQLLPKSFKFKKFGDVYKYTIRPYQNKWYVCYHDDTDEYCFSDYEFYANTLIESLYETMVFFIENKDNIELL